MASPRYHYNAETCKYEPIVVTGKVFAKRTLLFLGVSFSIGLGCLFYFNYRYPHWDETQLKNENAGLRSEWQVLSDQLNETDQKLANLERNDDNTYRAILDLHPLGSSVREGGVGGREKEAAYIPYPLIRSTYDYTEKIVTRLEIEQQSFDQLFAELNIKEQMWASRPAIQPVSNEDLLYLHTMFGLRLHPKYGFVRAHRGLDFTAPAGAPIYATGDGVVERAEYSASFGNVVYIDHGFHFETRYAHMTNFIVQKGDAIKRGQVIGYVGGTGSDSVGPHLHYEVLFKGEQINPINFFQRDLNNKEYERLIEIGSQSIISLD
jgi:murein DD-endopeptidase MepM/ murein hydrolase activator NlpD